MNFLISCLILSFSYDFPIMSLYSNWATIKLSDIVGCLVVLGCFFSRNIKIINMSLPLSAPFVLYFFICVLTSLHTFYFLSDSRSFEVAFQYSGYYIFKLFEFLIFYFILAGATKNEITGNKFLFTFWLGALFVSGYGILQHMKVIPNYWGDKVLMENIVTSSLAYHHSTLGFYMLLIIFITIGLLLKEKKNLWKIIFSLSILLFVYLEILSLSRSAWVGLSSGLVLWAFSLKGNFDKKIKLLFVLVVIVIVTLFIFKNFSQTSERLDPFYDLLNRFQRGVPGVESEVTIDARINVFSFFVDVLKNNPLILLYGNGFLSSPVRYDYTGSHNQFMDVLIDSGIFGLLFYIWLLFKMLTTLKKFYSKNYSWYPIYHGFFFALIGLIIGSFSSGFLNITHPFGNYFGFFMSLLGVVVGMGCREI
ncbi:MAG: O-antigen ligase family protein [Candidatus Omnitrophica bacterium]|nr:O-antigen ligase family protein [Candidatus Omnitrophota bacterium]